MFGARAILLFCAGQTGQSALPPRTGLSPDPTKRFARLKAGGLAPGNPLHGLHQAGNDPDGPEGRWRERQ